jgi:hypothetical protein
MAQFLCPHGREAGISHSRANGAPNDALAKRMFGLYDADTTAQAFSKMKTDEQAAVFGEDAVGGNAGAYLAAQHHFGDGQARQT